MMQTQQESVYNTDRSFLILFFSLVNTIKINKYYIHIGKIILPTQPLAQTFKLF